MPVPILSRLRHRFAGTLRRHRTALALLVLAVLGLCLFRATRGNREWMDAWLTHVSMPVKRVLSALVDPLPFSACEAAATLAILASLVLLVRAVVLAVRRVKNRLGTWLLHFVTLILWIYLLVCALWGTQYYGVTFAEQAGMTGGPVAVEDLNAVTAYFAAKVNETAMSVPRTDEGVFAADTRTILDQSAGIYDGITGEYPFLAGPQRNPKPAFYSKLMSAFGFTGYLCPLFGESTLNVDCPAVFLPVTVAHEFAHQRGVAAEQEANFCGIYASVNSDNPLYSYSGWLYGYLHLSNALYEADPDLAAARMEELCPQAIADLAQNNAYWAAWEGPAEEVGDVVYEGFLQSYDQKLGMRSYGACVDLLVEKYLPLAG